LFVAVILLISAYGFLKLIKTNNLQKKTLTAKEIVEVGVEHLKDKLPKAIGNNGDSCIKISAINDHCMEYLYKMNSRISKLDSLTIKSFISKFKLFSKDNLNKLDPEVLDEFRKNKIAFRYKFLDIDGNIIGEFEIKDSDY